MALTAVFIYDQFTDMLHKSAHILVTDDVGPSYRHYEEPALLNAVDSAAVVFALRTVQYMWDNGVPLTGIEMRKLKFLQDASAAHTQIAATLGDAQAGQTAAQADQVTLTGSPTQAQVLSVVRRIVDREVIGYTRKQQELNREDQMVSALERVIRELVHGL